MSSSKGEQRCIFCQAATSRRVDESLVLLKTPLALVMLNRYPYTNGHLMVAPVRHAGNLFETDQDILEHLIRLTAEAQRILSEVYQPDGFNIGMNLGQAAGAGFGDHYHMHVVPRWTGDSNFMSVTGKTRLVPEEIETTLERLRPKFQKLRRTFLKTRG